MSAKITVQDGQSIYDIALQEYGSVEGVFHICEDNEGVNLEDELQTGQQLLIAHEPIDAQVVEYYRRKGLKPSNGTTEPAEYTPPPQPEPDECDYKWNELEW